MKMTIVREYLKNHDYYEDFIGLTDHPDCVSSEKVFALSLFAKDMNILDELVTKFEREGYKVWIKGKMDEVPAAYLYKE